MTATPTLNDLLAVLPQWQCGLCGQPDCRGYANALLDGDARVDQCPPGGDWTARALAQILGVLPPHDPVVSRLRTGVWIRPRECIGCGRCRPACPIDAIVGAAKSLHAVRPEACTGCGLCLPACPVDCIDLLPLAPPTAMSGPWPGWTLRDAQMAAVGYARRSETLPSTEESPGPDGRVEDGRARRLAEIASAVQRVKRRRRRTS